VVDVILSDDQRLLHDSTRQFLVDRSSVGALRRLVGQRIHFDRDAWHEGAQQGWVGILTPEQYGGFVESSQGVIDAAIVAEELGRVVYSGPFLPVSVVAQAITQAASDLQRQEILPALAGGESIAAWCFAAPGVKAGLEAGGVRVVRSGDGYVLDGVAAYVQDATIADWLLVSAVSDHGVSQFLLPPKTAGVSVAALEALDLGRRLANVRFEGVRVSGTTLVGKFGDAGLQFERQLQTALTLQCAETVGVIDRALEITLEYVQQRMAFGRPIGSFQALKHRLADHATQLEGARAAVAHAAKAVQKRADDASIAVSVAKSHCGRFGTEIVRDCLHMHGGIGMTWDHDIHFYLRRAVSNEALWGAPPVHHERLCRLAGL
jgi:alkylation response protein AidB-like acyl-CoA dehydrogenase